MNRPTAKADAVQQHSRDDILNTPRRYPQRPATISSTPRDDILIFNHAYRYQGKTM
ncbi:MAG: hypothetical protein IJ557_08790 [Bacteroidaceae bacterium]|nr:hypothetical protein [Bacteroidaceae bacterium]MBR1379204.1 hypothetical protein [Bacteroidaceae bacterium]